MNTHTFTQSGLGDAPFTVIRPKQNAIEAASGIFWCEHCGTQIIHRNFVQSACGKVSVVGIDCLKKTGDLGLIEGAKRIKREQRSAELEAERMARVAACEERERQINGGKTNSEIIAERNAELEIMSAEFREIATQSPVLAALGDSLFEKDMSHYFYLLKPFSAGQLRVLKEIVTKKSTGARKNSKAYKAGYGAAAESVDLAQEMLSRYHLALETHRQETRLLGR